MNFLITDNDMLTLKIHATPSLKDKWTGAMLDPSGKAYCGAFKLSFSADCNTEKIRSSIALALSRQPILAARFSVHQKNLSGLAPTPSELYELLLTQLKETHYHLTDEQFIDFRANHPSDIGLRLVSGYSGDQLNIWIGFWTFTCDGVSIDMLIDDIVQYYRHETLPTRMPWNDFAIAKQAGKASLIMTDEMKHSIYSGNGPWGMDAIRQKNNDTLKTQMTTVPFTFDILRTDIISAARANRTTPFAILFGSFQRSVSRMTSLTQIVTGIPFANRLHENEQSVFGPVSTTVPVSTSHSPDRKSLKDELPSIQKALMLAAKLQNSTPTDLYPEKLSPQTSSSELPFAQLFNAWNTQRQGKPITLTSANETLLLTLLPNGTCRAGFEITMNEQAETICGRIDMDATAYGPVSLDLLTCMETELKSLIKASGSKLSK